MVAGVAGVTSHHGPVLSLFASLGEPGHHDECNLSLIMPMMMESDAESQARRENLPPVMMAAP
jgi:hypothetical protein